MRQPWFFNRGERRRRERRWRRREGLFLQDVGQGGAKGEGGVVADPAQGFGCFGGCGACAGNDVVDGLAVADYHGFGVAVVHEAFAHLSGVENLLELPYDNVECFDICGCSPSVGGVAYSFVTHGECDSVDCVLTRQRCLLHERSLVAVGLCLALFCHFVGSAVVCFGGFAAGECERDSESCSRKVNFFHHTISFPRVITSRSRMLPLSRVSLTRVLTFCHPCCPAAPGLTCRSPSCGSGITLSMWECPATMSLMFSRRSRLATPGE